MQFKNTLISTALVLALAGCGSSSDSNTSQQPEQSAPVSQDTTFTLGISDAPVSGVTQIWVAFDSITLRNDAGEDTSFTTPDSQDETKPTMVNLLEYTGDDLYALLTDKEVAAGTYMWLRADVINGDAQNFETTSHVVYEDGTMAPLIVKRKGNDNIGEIQMSGFTLQEGENEFVLEFDLKKSLNDPKNSDEVQLKPTGVRLENLAESQDINGTVDSSVIANCETDNVELAGEGGVFGHAVYVYSSDVVEPKDLYEENEEAPADAPLATANVTLNENTGQHEFTLAFLSAGDYLVAYTCTAHLDDPEVLDESVTLYQQQNVTLLSGEDTSITFTPE